ncbi:hypothetical protein MMPV_007354 [Pyropia vietnamensis]
MGFLKITAAVLAVLSAAASASACAILYEQCGGAQYKDGPTCCTTGLTCMVMNKWYSQCRPLPSSEGQIPPYEQCGGSGYTGSTMCTPGFQCTEIDASFSNCDQITKRSPTPPKLSPTEPPPPGKVCGKEYQVCGGKGFNGPRCCKFGLQCVMLSEYNSQCLPPKPKEGELGPYEQCGGSGFKGTGKCVPAYSCVAVPAGGAFKQCRPLHP